MLINEIIFHLKTIFAFQQSGMLNGWVTFVMSILLIGLVTAVIGDVAAQLGCFIYLKDSVNAIAFVALGTSVPGVLEKVFGLACHRYESFCLHEIFTIMKGAKIIL